MAIHSLEIATKSKDKVDPPAINELKELLKSLQYEILTDSGKVLPPTNEIFKTLSSAMSDSMRKKPKTIYTILLENRYNALNEVLQAKNITLQNNNSALLNDSLNSTLDTVLEFAVGLTKVWPDMEPETVNYEFQSRGRRELQKLKRHSWTDALYEAIVAKTQIPCELNFKYNEISESGLYLKVPGDCPDCGAEFRGIIANAPTEGKPIIIECYIRGFDRSVKHTTKRQLKGRRRQKVATEVIESNMLPCVWRRKKADEVIKNVGDDEPANMPKGSAISKAVVQTRDKMLGLIPTNNVFESLEAMKFNSRYESSIHSIGFYEFCVLHWTPEQVVVYRQFHKTLYIDGTGSVVTKIKRPVGESPHIYLYQAVTRVNGKTAPVFQILSGDQSTVALTRYFFEFLRSGEKETPNFPLPDEVITDFDKAIIGGLAIAYAKKSSLKEYLSCCLEFLEKRIPEAPPCILRLDICHFINIIAKWKCYRGTPFGAKSMCIRAMAVLRRQGSLEALKKVAEHIFLLVLSRSSAIGGLADNARLNLTRLIRGIPNTDLTKTKAAMDTEADIGTDDESEDELENRLRSKRDELLNSTEDFPKNTWEWTTRIYEACVAKVKNEQFDDSGNVNGFHNAKFAKNLKNLLPYFPLFSEIMRVACGKGSENATSAAVESEINDIKNHVMKNVRLPLRADRFVAMHVYLRKT